MRFLPFTFHAFLAATQAAPLSLSAQEADRVHQRASQLLEGRGKRVLTFFTGLSDVRHVSIVVAIAIFVLSFVWWLAESVFSDSPGAPLLSMGLATGFATLVLLSDGVAAWVRHVRSAQHRASPLSRTRGNECKRALEVVRTSAGARQLRDTVLARGEELRVYHLLGMLERALEEAEQEQTLAQAQQAQAAEQERLRDCRELHGLPSELA